MLRVAGWFGSSTHYNLQVIDRANSAQRGRRRGVQGLDGDARARRRHGGGGAARRVLRAARRAGAQGGGGGEGEGEGGGVAGEGEGEGDAAAAAPAPAAPVHSTDAQVAKDALRLKHTRLTLSAPNVREIVADTELQKAAAEAVQSRAAEMGLVLPPEKAGKLVTGMLVKK